MGVLIERDLTKEYGVEPANPSESSTSEHDFVREYGIPEVGTNVRTSDPDYFGLHEKFERGFGEYNVRVNELSPRLRAIVSAYRSYYEVVMSLYPKIVLKGSAKIGIGTSGSGSIVSGSIQGSYSHYTGEMFQGSAGLYGGVGGYGAKAGFGIGPQFDFGETNNTELSSNISIGFGGGGVEVIVHFQEDGTKMKGLSIRPNIGPQWGVFVGQEALKKKFP